LYTIFESGITSPREVEALSMAKSRELAQASLRIVEAELQRSLGLDLRLVLHESGGVLRPAMDEGFWYRGEQVISALSAPESLVEIADMVQDLVLDREMIAWPQCDVHEKLLRATLQKKAEWVCPEGPHVVAPIGGLGRR
jgi:hypothetical protein